MNRRFRASVSSLASHRVLANSHMRKEFSQDVPGLWDFKFKTTDVRKLFLLVVQFAVVMVFGLVVPILLCIQAHSSMAAMEKYTNRFEYTKLADVLPAVSNIKTPRTIDYTFAAVLVMESSTRYFALCKQRMKMAVMQVGFAVISLGIMFIFLGVDAGGVDANGALPRGEAGFGFSLKIASTGLVAFIIGASMVAAGGLLRNQYAPPDVPTYDFESSLSSPASVGNVEAAKRELEKHTAWCLKNKSVNATELSQCLKVAAAYALDPRESSKGE